MYIVECSNCREACQLNDLVKNKTLRCHICKKIIQVGEIKKEVVKNINQLDDHELRIEAIENKDIDLDIKIAREQIENYTYNTPKNYTYNTPKNYTYNTPIEKHNHSCHCHCNNHCHHSCHCTCPSCEAVGVVFGLIIIVGLIIMGYCSIV